ATYHGPGQLMGYPIIDLRGCGQDLHKYLRWLEQLLIDLLAEFEVASSRRESLTGVWVGDRKIASIGVGVRHWITMHGFALNVSGDLSPFNHIVPCGINNVAMTSMEKETGAAFSVTRVAASIEKLVLNRIGDLRVIREAQPINVYAIESTEYDLSRRQRCLYHRKGATRFVHFRFRAGKKSVRRFANDPQTTRRRCR